ncbi:MAG TPA: FliA/WhiG family RNA polymerase sigma factor [Blastocatellia bacterium]|nr:FliA/WhiG family RNA polymerase sigma factor [Blastocatellia bacterium]
MATAVISLEIPFCFDLVSKQSLVEDHVSLVRYLATRLSAKLPPSIEVDDLVGAGMIGLIDAAEKFDPSRGIRFRTYAERRIRGAILDHLRSLDWAPRSLRRRARELESAHVQLERERGRAVDVTEVAEYLDIEVGELQTLLHEINATQMASLHNACDNDSDAAWFTDPIQSLPDSPELSPFAQYAREETRAQLAAAIDSLPEKERLVVSLYYVEELTMKEIGTVIGVNESRVSQIHSKAVSRLRSTMGHLAA